MPEHNCLEHLVCVEHEWTEPHGERCRQEWWECSWCQQQFTERELEQLTKEEQGDHADVTPKP